MKSACPATDLEAGESSIVSRRRTGVAGILIAAIFFCASIEVRSQSGGRIGGPSGGQVAGAAVGVGAGLAVVAVVLINHGHHSLTGCVTNGANGMKLTAGDARVYSLQGDAASIKVGDKVKVHGSKVKKAKGAEGDQTFTVDKVSKDYGPCSADVARSTNGAH